MKILDSLYARNSNNSINSWTISVQPLPNMTALIHIEEGQLKGKETRTSRAVNKGKNINKMNETTAYEQACNEAQSRWEKKKKQGYKSLEDIGIKHQGSGVYHTTAITGGNTWSSIDELIELLLPQNRTDDNNISKPMKAQPYFKDNGDVRIKFPCYGQPKLNGFRVMARWEKVKENVGTLLETEVEKVVFRSKEGLRYDILEHIENEFTKDMFEINLYNKINISQEASIPLGFEVVFDGEMYIHNEILSEISSAVRKKNSKTEKLKFCIFDIAISEINQKSRIIFLDKFAENYLRTSNNIKNIIVVSTTFIKSNEDAQRFTDECIQKGYEGAIFRDTKAFYEFGKRPQTMVKLKRFQDKEFKIVDVIGGDNSPELGVFICVQEQGLKFKVTPEGTQETKKEYLFNKTKYIGKNLTVRFFERTKDNLPFHAVGTTIRDYE